MENKDDISTGKDTSEMQQSSRSPFGVLVAFLILLFICFIAAIVVLADPFDWDLLDSFKGTDNAALDSMPVDTGLYVGLDMDRFTTTELARIIDPFLVLDIGLDYREFAEIMMELNNQMETSFGFNLTEDILPWIGPNVAVGLVDYEYDQYGSLDTAQVLVVAEVKDDQAADNFVDKFVAGVSDESGNSFSEETYKGVTISELQAESEDDRISIAHADGIVYFGSSAEVVKRGIDASSGESLAEDEGYKTLEAQMDPERAVTAYFSHEFIQESTGGFGSDFPIDLQDIPYIGSGGGAVTLSFTDQGLRFDGLSAVDKEELTEVERLALQGSKADTAERFPSNTILYFTGLSISQYWQSLLDASPDYAEAMAGLQDEIGFDIVNELFVYLDGETGVGLWPGSSGLLANAAQIPLSFSLLGGSSDESSVSAAAESITQTLEDNFLTVEQEKVNGATVYSIYEPFTGLEASYGLSDGYFFLASGADAANEMINGESTLASSDSYKAVWGAFPDGYSPVLYLDMDGLEAVLTQAAAVPPTDIVKTLGLLSPIEHIALGGDFSGDVTKISAIVTFD